MNVRQFQGSNLHTTDGGATGIVELSFGETVSYSGIYEVIHGDAQTDLGLTLVALRGEKVQRCLRCGEEVRLRLVHAAPHISEDDDFSSSHEPR